MRVLFTSQIGSGHWRPLAPVARAAALAGHEVAFATTPIGCAIIAGHGFRTFPVGDDDWQRPRPPREAGTGSDEPAQAETVAREVFIPAAARPRRRPRATSGTSASTSSNHPSAPLTSTTRPT